jgi:integrase
MAHNLFAFAEGLELVDVNPVSKVKPPRYDKRQYPILSHEQYERLLTACEHNPFLQLYALVLGETGMRCESEALWIQWEDIDLEGGFIKIVSGRNEHRTKSGEGRWVPLTGRLRQALSNHSAQYRLRTYAGHRSQWVFHHDYRRRRAEAGERIGSLRRAFGNAVTRAGLPAGFTQHDLRHRRITVWLAEGKSAVLVKEAVGHSDLRTTMAYTHLSREHLRALVSGSEDRPGKAKELQKLVS